MDFIHVCCLLALLLLAGCGESESNGSSSTDVSVTITSDSGGSTNESDISITGVANVVNLGGGDGDLFINGITITYDEELSREDLNVNGNDVRVGFNSGVLEITAGVVSYHDKEWGHVQKGDSIRIFADGSLQIESANGGGRK